ncbi:hypothetical protein [Pseudomonas sp. TE3610]
MAGVVNAKHGVETMMEARAIACRRSLQPSRWLKAIDLEGLGMHLKILTFMGSAQQLNRFASIAPTFSIVDCNTETAL